MLQFLKQPLIAHRAPQVFEHPESFDCRREQVGVGLQECDVRLGEPARPAVDLKDAVGLLAIGADDEDVGERMHAVVRQELGIGEPLLVRDVIRGDRLAAADRAALGRAGARVHDRMVDDTGLPPDAGTHQQRLAVGTQLHDLRKVGPERLADEAACLGEDLVELHRTQRQVAEPGQHALLGEQHPLLVVRLFGHGPPG